MTLPTFLSLGAGVQSSTLALMCAAGEIEPMPRAAIFADTQAEPRAVYEWLDWLEPQLPFPVHRVTEGSLADEIGRPRKTGVWPVMPIPAFIEGVDGKAAPINRSCTQDFKIKPIRRKVRELLGLTGKRSPDAPVATQFIGISLDEFHRMKPSREPWIEHRPMAARREADHADGLYRMDEGARPTGPAEVRVYVLPVPRRDPVAGDPRRPSVVGSGDGDRRSHSRPLARSGRPTLPPSEHEAARRCARRAVARRRARKPFRQRVRRNVRRMTQRACRPGDRSQADTHVLKTIEPYDPPPEKPTRTHGRSRKSAFRRPFAGGDGAAKMASPSETPIHNAGVCCVSGCGNEINSERFTDSNGRWKHHLICRSCLSYAKKKILAMRKPGDQFVIADIPKVLRALGVNFDERFAPVTGRGAAFQHGHGGRYPRERRDG